jgi:uncharacterized protein
VKIEEKDGWVRLTIYVQPRASRTEISGIHGDALKVRIAAPPVDGEANAELERFLAKLFALPRSSVRVVGGATSRTKVVALEGVTRQQVESAIQ